MTAQTAAFALYVLYAAIILFGGVLAVAARSLVRALCGLVLTLFGVAGMYLLMNAPFLALMQLLIYVGAVAVLIFFAIMLAGGEEGERSKPAVAFPLAMLVAAAPPAAAALALWKKSVPGLSVPAEASIEVLGKFLLEDYVLAFELISVALFAAMAGAVVLAFERRRAG